MRSGIFETSCSDLYGRTSSGLVNSFSGSFIKVLPTRTLKPVPDPGPTTDDMLIPNTGFGGSFFSGGGASVVFDLGTSTGGFVFCLVRSTGFGFGGSTGGGGG